MHDSKYSLVSFGAEMLAARVETFIWRCTVFHRLTARGLTDSKYLHEGRLKQGHRGFGGSG